MSQNQRPGIYKGPIGKFTADLQRELQMISQAFYQLTRNTSSVFIQDTAPQYAGKFFWIQTNVGGSPADFMVWFDDGT